MLGPRNLSLSEVPWPLGMEPLGADVSLEDARHPSPATASATAPAPAAPAAPPAAPPAVGSRHCKTVVKSLFGETVV